MQKAHKPSLIVVNKWDLVKPERGAKETLAQVLQETRERLFFLPYAPDPRRLGAHGRKCRSSFQRDSQNSARRRCERISTGVLNRLLRDAFAANPPPMVSNQAAETFLRHPGRGAREKTLATPEFVLFVNDPQLLGDTYARYLEAQIREAQPFLGLPLMLNFRPRTESASHKGCTNGACRDRKLNALSDAWWNWCRRLEPHPLFLPSATLNRRDHALVGQAVGESWRRAFSAPRPLARNRPSCARSCARNRSDAPAATSARCRDAIAFRDEDLAKAASSGRIVRPIKLEPVHLFEIENERAAAAVDLNRQAVLAPRREAGRFQSGERAVTEPAKDGNRVIHRYLAALAALGRAGALFHERFASSRRPRGIRRPDSGRDR